MSYSNGSVRRYQSDSDVKYLMRWADSFHEVRLADGAVVRGSGRALIFADILQTVLHGRLVGAAQHGWCHLAL
jgi:hypothetical protein